MKRLPVSIIILLVLFVVFNAGFGQTQGLSLKDRVKTDVINQINAGIISNVNIDRLAVYAFTNDKDSEITDALITKLKESERYTILDRSEPDEYSEEVEKLLNNAGFFGQTWVQTLAQPLSKIQEIEPLREGREHAGFVVVSAARS